MPRLSAKGTSLSGDPFLQDSMRRNPHCFDLDAIVVLILFRMLKPEDLLGPVAVVFVQVSERNHIDRLVIPKDFAKLLLKVATLIFVIVRTVHVSKIEENSTAVFQLDQAGIGVADGEEPNNMHTRSLRMGSFDWHEANIHHATEITTSCGEKSTTAQHERIGQVFSITFAYSAADLQVKIRGF
ncbi:hypothetical protein D9M71_448100 [compost metagenome]